jgi:hypothetical protein
MKEPQRASGATALGLVQWRPIPRTAVPPSRLPNDLQVQQKEQNGEAGH